VHTNIDIDQDLLREALELGHSRAKKAVVNEALAEFVRARKQRRILELAGTIDFDPDFDYKAARRAR
jgi:Arc/MetJ family transcription regulator